MATVPPPDQIPLQVATAEVIQHDLSRDAAFTPALEGAKNAELISNEYVEKLFAYDPTNVSEKESNKSSVENMATDVQS